MITAVYRIVAVVSLSWGVVRRIFFRTGVGICIVLLRMGYVGCQWRFV